MKDSLHIAPALLIALVLTPFIIMPADEKVTYIRTILNKEFNFIRMVSVIAISILVVYIIISMNELLKYIKKENRSQQKIIVLMILLFTWLLMGIVGFIIAATLSLSLIKWFSLFNSFVLAGIYFLHQKYPFLIQYASVPIKKSYSQSKLNKVDKEQLNIQLSILMEEEKFYCDEDLSLKRLSGALDITPHQLSQFLNEYHKKNFNTYINAYRIEEAKILLLEDLSRNTLSIAYEVGFNAYSSFHRVFRNLTGYSPAEFRSKFAGN